MTFYYDLDLVGIALMLFTGVALLVGNGRSQVNGNYLYLFSLISLFMVLDLVTTVMLKEAHAEQFMLWYVLLVLQYTDLILMPCAVFYFFLNECKSRAKPFTPLLVSLVLVVVLIATNYKYNLFYICTINPDGSFSFTFGKFMWIIYLYYLLYIAAIFVTAHHHRIFFGKVRRTVLWIDLVIAIIAFVIQIVVPQISISALGMGFLAVNTTMGFFFLDDNTDRNTGLHNLEGFTRAVQELVKYYPEYTFEMRVIKIHNLNEMRERLSRDIAEKVVRKYADDLKNYYEDRTVAIGRIDTDELAVFARPEDYFEPPQGKSVSEYTGCSIDKPLDYELAFYIGVYVRQPDDTLDVDGMLDRASFAMDSVNGSFSKRKAVFNGILEAEYDRSINIENKVRSVIKKQHFSVYLQPIVDTKTGALLSAEALVRWVEEDGKLISPGDFIPVFEKNGFITQLDLYVLDEVCRQQKEWIDKGITPVPVSVNISRVDLNHPGLVDDIINTVDKYGISHDLIKIELTESAFNRDEELIKNTLNRLHDAGFKILMDDFGSGYSNLNMFEEMPVDIVKIDMRFLKNIDKSEKGRIVLESVTEMSDKMGLKTVAEGVENISQYKVIHDLDCDMIQGYYFSRPVPEKEFEKYLTSE